MPHDFALETLSRGNGYNGSRTAPSYSSAPDAAGTGVGLRGSAQPRAGEAGADDTWTGGGGGARAEEGVRARNELMEMLDMSQEDDYLNPNDRSEIHALFRTDGEAEDSEQMAFGEVGQKNKKPGKRARCGGVCREQADVLAGGCVGV